MKDETSENSGNKGIIKFLIACLIISVVAFAIIWYAPSIFKAKPSIIDYNGFQFEKVGALWYTQWQNGPYVYNVPLRYNPEEVEDVQIIGELSDKFNDAPNVYVTFDPTQNESLKWVALAKGELIWSLIGPLQKNSTDSCSVNSTECEGFPIVDCSHKDKSVIYLVPSETPKVLADGTCVVIEGKDIELTKSVDRFLYQWYGIMK